MKLMNYEDARALEAKLLTTDKLAAKYRRTPAKAAV